MVGERVSRLLWRGHALELRAEVSRLLQGLPLGKYFLVRFFLRDVQITTQVFSLAHVQASNRVLGEAPINI